MTESAITYCCIAGPVEFNEGDSFHRSIDAGDYLVDRGETVRSESFRDLPEDHLVGSWVLHMQDRHGKGLDIDLECVNDINGKNASHLCPEETLGTRANNQRGRSKQANSSAPVRGLY